MLNLLDKGDDFLYWFFQGPYRGLIPIIQEWKDVYSIEMMTIIMMAGYNV